MKMPEGVRCMSWPVRGLGSHAHPSMVAPLGGAFRLTVDAVME
jgi:hypothetical protein